MNQYKVNFMAYLEANGIIYEDIGENALVITYNASNINVIRVVVQFEEDNANYATFHAFGLCKMEDEQRFARSVMICNEMNKAYRWVKFYMDDDRDLTISADAVIDLETVGEECLEIVLRICQIGDKALPEFFKARWA